MLRSCSLTPGRSPKPRLWSLDAHPTETRHDVSDMSSISLPSVYSLLARNLFSWRTQMALTRRRPASSRAHRVKAMAAAAGEGSGDEGGTPWGPGVAVGVAGPVSVVGRGVLVEGDVEDGAEVGAPEEVLC